MKKGADEGPRMWERTVELMPSQPIRAWMEVVVESAKVSVIGYESSGFVVMEVSFLSRWSTSSGRRFRKAFQKDVR